MSTKLTSKSKKQEYGIVRNGEHIERDFFTAEAAEARVKILKAQDVEAAKAGWFPMSSALATRYYVETIRTRSW